MAISDKKKTQSVINAVGREVQVMRDGLGRIEIIKAQFVDQAVDPAGTPLAGNVALLNTALSNLDTALTAAAFDGLIAAIVPTHRGIALDR